MTRKTLTRAARDLQTAANRLALMTRNHNRDTILAGLFPDVVKGQRAAARLEEQRPVMEALEAEVMGLRKELGAMLDEIRPPAPSPADERVPGEPPTKKRKKTR